MRLFAVTLCGLFLCLAARQTSAQTTDRFTRADSLRGGLRPERTGFDVLFYDLSLSVDPATRSIAGSNTIRYKVVAPMQRMQIDLFANMQVLSITQNKKPLRYVRDGNALFITMADKQRVGEVRELTISYNGKPQAAKNPPWDGGFVWRKDTTTAKNADWVTVACEHTGASLWWPNKDHLSDEPDSMRIRCRVPAGLTCVANGQFRGQKPVNNGRQTEWTWFISYPINNYNVTLNITDYAHFSDTYTAKDGQKLALDYYVLPGNVQKAKAHFEQVKTMLACYETHFGKYPFWRDGYKLVETPYWGMEHQSAVAYGNKYRNNPFGFDFIIIHESGHEYFGNSLSCADHAEMWIHESFTTYAEALFLECTQGLPRTIEYLNGQRKQIKNEYAMLGPLGVNADQHDTDIYYKGTWMLHTLRFAVNDDAKWFAALKALATEKQHSVVYTDEVIALLCQKTGVDLRPLFDQYLRHPKLPVFEYRIDTTDKTKPSIRYRWQSDIAGFNLPVQIKTGNGQWQTLVPGREWKNEPLSGNTADGFVINTDIGLFNVRVIPVE